MLVKEVSLPAVQAAIDRRSTARAPGINGIPPSTFRVFSDVRCPHLLEEMKGYINGDTLSSNLLIGLMYMIPKTNHSFVVSRMCPICVGNTRLKWITTVLFIQIEEILAQSVHPSQVDSIRGRQMQNHLWSPGSLCEALPSYVAVEVNFVTQFTSRSHLFISWVLKCFCLHINYIRPVIIGMKAPHKFMLGVRPIQNIMFSPECGICEGGILSPTPFSMYGSLFLWQPWAEYLLDLVSTFMCVDDLMLVFPTEHGIHLVEQVMDCMQLYGSVSGLCINFDRTRWMCKNVWTSMELLMYDLGFRQVSSIWYLGVRMGDMLSLKAYAVPVALHWQLFTRGSSWG